MAENRCLLTPEGKEARDELLKFLYPGGINKAKLADVTGLDRGASIPKLLRQNQGDTVQSGTILDFFKAIYTEIHKELNDKNTPDERKSKARKLLNHFANKVGDNLFCKSCFYSEVQVNSIASVTENKNLTPSIEQQTAEALLLLDYSEQTKLFQEKLDNRTKVCTFALQVTQDDEVQTLQKFSAKRLSQYLVGGEIPRYITISVTSSIRNQGVNYLWGEIAPFFSKDKSAKISDIKREILSICKTRSVVFVFYKFSNIGRCFSSFMNEFWYPLAEQVSSESPGDQRQRLILLIAGEQSSLSVNFEDTHEYSPLLLPSLDKITSSHVEGSWMKIHQFSQLQNRCSAESRSISLEKIKNWGDKAYGAIDAMELICGALGFNPEDLGRISKFWELSGDRTA